MKQLLDELLERSEFLRSQEQNIETKAKIEENSLCVIRVQQLILENLNCNCSYPIDASNGTQRCVKCGKKIKINLLKKDNKNLLNNNNGNF